MSAYVQQYVTEQLTSPAFVEKQTFKIVTHPRTEEVINEKVSPHIPTLGLVFIGSTFLGVAMYRRLVHG